MNDQNYMTDWCYLVKYSSIGYDSAINKAPIRHETDLCLICNNLTCVNYLYFLCLSISSHYYFIFIISHLLLSFYIHHYCFMFIIIIFFFILYLYCKSNVYLSKPIYWPNKLENFCQYQISSSSYINYLYAEDRNTLSIF